MRKLIIDRFEGTYAICEDQEKKMFAISLNELPQGAKPGDVLQISGAGELSVAVSYTHLTLPTKA